MVFNSISFLAFFGIFFFLYWLAFSNSLKQQNLFLLLGSYLFYAWADWRLLAFLVAVTALNYYLGIYIAKNTRYKRALLYIGLFQCIGSLIYFKFFNFFIVSFNDLFHSLKININLRTLNLLVPLGISFFTFKIISYLLDIEKGKIKPVKDIIVFFNYVSFFPSILAGPIDKAKNFIPQLENRRVFDYTQSIDGLKQILWGLFKKAVIADNCALITNPIFESYHSFPGSTLLIASFFYAIQMYADFSGYSDMAIGVSRLLGFNITKNFDFPFFAQNIAEYWRKWHISLTIWLTEYVFTPLSIALRDYNKAGIILAIIINFTICGIWHGANWTYILFGFMHGCYFIPLILKGTMNKKKLIAHNRTFPSAKEIFNVLRTFILVMLTFVIFRSESVPDAFQYYKGIFSRSLFSFPLIPSGIFSAIITLIFIFIMFIIEWLGREQQYAIAYLGASWKRPFRYAMYYLLLIIIFILAGKNQQFIYFQF